MDLALPGEAVNLLEACSGDTALEDAKVLLRVYVEGLLVYVGVWVDVVFCVVGVVGGIDVVQVVE